MRDTFFSRRRLLQGALALCLAQSRGVLAADTAGTTTLFDIRIPRDTRVKHFYLQNPSRLVLDLHETSLAELKAEFDRAVIVRGAELVDVRIGQNTPTVVRVVLSFSKNLRATVKTEPRGKHDGLSVSVPSSSISPPLEKNETSASSLGQEHTTAPRTRFTVVVDAGHGGADPGAIGPSGKLEKDITLNLALKMSEMFSARPDFEIILTRHEDVFVPLQRRVAIAREAKADVFLSIHADAWTQADVRGASVFVLSERGASSSMAKLLANKENEVDRFGGLTTSDDLHLAMTLLDLAQTVTKAESNRLARQVLSGIRGTAHIRKNYVEHAGFAVLKAPDVPSVLVETAFISNPEEELLLSSPDYQEALAGKLVSSVEQYLRLRA